MESLEKAREAELLFLFKVEEMNKDNKRRENIFRNIAVVTGAIKYFKCFYNYTQVISIVRRVQVNYTRMCISSMKQTPDKSLKWCICWVDVSSTGDIMKMMFTSAGLKG